MFNRLLIPLDGSLPATSALVAGERLAEQFDADLHVLTLTRKGRSEVGLSRVIERQVARIEHQPRVDVRPLSYTVAEDIADEFDRVEGTLVVMSTWARGRAAGVISNVAEDVLRLVREPVVMLGPHSDVSDRWLGGPMMIATDGSHFGDTVADFAARMAAKLDIQARLITVIDPTKVPAGIPTAAEANSVAVLAGSLNRSADHQPVDHRPVDYPPVDYEVLHNNRPADGITDYARHEQASMIAMSTHGRSGTWRLTAGSVAMDVVRQAHCPVLLHRPPTEDGKEGSNG